MRALQPAVTIANRQRSVRVPAKKIVTLVKFIVTREGPRVEQVDVAVVGRREMARLNRQYLRHAGSTDVLSFDLGAGPAGGLCAEIVVCSDVAIRLAKARGHSTWKELLLYVTHGLLHAMGYDDRSSWDAKRMHAREDDLLEAFGVGRVYQHG
jgi:probable rRNA maturation factor